MFLLSHLHLEKSGYILYYIGFINEININCGKPYQFLLSSSVQKGTLNLFIYVGMKHLYDPSNVCSGWPKIYGWVRTYHQGITWCWVRPLTITSYQMWQGFWRRTSIVLNYAKHCICSLLWHERKVLGQGLEFSFSLTGSWQTALRCVTSTFRIIHKSFKCFL